MSGWLQSGNGSRVSKLASILNSKSVVIAGNITINPHVSLHGDVAMADTDAHAITIGKYSYIDSNAVIRPPVAKNDLCVPMSIGAYCIIGKNSVINLLAIGNRVIVEDDCHLQNLSVVYDCCLIRKNTIVPPKMVIPPYSEVSGVPGVDFKIEQLNPRYKKLIELEAKQLNVLG